MLPPAAAFLPELTFATSRASGPGGQNVNKVESRVELRWHLLDSQVLTDVQKQLLLEKLASRLTADGYLLVVTQDDRSQLRNRELALGRFHQLLEKSLYRPPVRRATRPSAGAASGRAGPLLPGPPRAILVVERHNTISYGKIHAQNQRRHTRSSGGTRDNVGISATAKRSRSKRILLGRYLVNGQVKAAAVPLKPIAVVCAAVTAWQHRLHN